MNKSEVIKKLALYHDELKKFSVKDLYLFGSYAREEAREQSDLDILVEFEAGAKIGLFEFARLRRQLCELLGREVDLVTPDAIRPEMKDQILREAVVIGRQLVIEFNNVKCYAISARTVHGDLCISVCNLKNIP